MWCLHSELTVLQYLHGRPFTCIVHAVSLIYSGIMHCCYGWHDKNEPSEFEYIYYQGVNLYNRASERLKSRLKTGKIEANIYTIPTLRGRVPTVPYSFTQNLALHSERCLLKISEVVFKFKIKNGKFQFFFFRKKKNKVYIYYIYYYTS